MGLVGLVLLIALAASVISNYQTQASRIESAVSQAIGRDPSSAQRPWIGQPNSAQPWTQGPSSSATQTPLQEDSPFVPVFVINIDPHSLTVFGDNSAFVLIDKDLANEALARIQAHLPQQISQNDVFTGLFIDLRLFYRVEVISGGSMTIALADASSLVGGTLQLAGISALIWLGAMVAFFFISLLLSRIALRPVIEAWERQRRFVADASHELKTPLTVILANNSLLLAHPDKTIAEQEQWVSSTQAEAQRMDKLVRDLLLLAQTDEEEKDAVAQAASLHPVDFSVLTRRSLLQFEAVFFERGIDLTADLAEGVTLPGNEEQLERLIQILLDNASKYAKAPDAGKTTTSSEGVESGAATVSVELLSAPVAGRHATLRVTNSGPAIDPAVLPHLFERFYRADSAHSDAEGSGLGLSLAQAIVKAHHGAIEVSSTPGAGTTFTLTL
jgi:signal transduction histidine kinase